jgi:hypothetical protein
MTLSRRVRSNYASELVGMNLGIGVNLDFGIAVYPEDGDLKESLMRVADERLYRLKLEGRESPPAEREPPPTERKASAAPGERAREFRDRQEVPPREATPPAREIPTAREPGPPKQAELRREEAPQGGAATAPAIPAAAAPAPGQRGSERRRWERVSLAGTRASAAIGEGALKQARILDLGYGGVALETAGTEEISESFPAVLNVPILPAVRVSLKKVYVVRGAGGVNRIGCAFAT